MRTLAAEHRHGEHEYYSQTQTHGERMPVRETADAGLWNLRQPRQPESPQSDLPKSSDYYHHQILLSKLRISSPEVDMVPWIGTNEEEELRCTRPDWSKLTGEREARGWGYHGRSLRFPHVVRWMVRMWQLSRLHDGRWGGKVEWETHKVEG